MSEMSLRQQIEQIEQLQRYLLEFCREFNVMEKELDDRIRYIRQTGMRTETADKMQDKYLREITKRKEELDEIMHAEYRYLTELKERFERIYQI